MAGIVNIAYYKEEDYNYFLSIIDDREAANDTWEEWHQEFLKIKFYLVSNGFLVKDVVVDLNELIDYCTKKKIKIDGAARSQFVASKK